MGIEEQLGEIVIAPRVLEKNHCYRYCKGRGCSLFSNRSVSDTLSKLSLGRGIYLKTWTKNSQQISISTLSTE